MSTVFKYVGRTKSWSLEGNLWILVDCLGCNIGMEEELETGSWGSVEDEGEELEEIGDSIWGGLVEKGGKLWTEWWESCVWEEVSDTWLGIGEECEDKAVLGNDVGEESELPNEGKHYYKIHTFWTLFPRRLGTGAGGFTNSRFSTTPKSVIHENTCIAHV